MDKNLKYRKLSLFFLSWKENLLHNRVIQVVKPIKVDPSWLPSTQSFSSKPLCSVIRQYLVTYYPLLPLGQKVHKSRDFFCTLHCLVNSSSINIRVRYFLIHEVLDNIRQIKNTRHRCSLSSFRFSSTRDWATSFSGKNFKDEASDSGLL